jgi:ABC-type multidrug transport system fused ATPase/permease subunit
VSLLLLTIANQCERFALGLMVTTGKDPKSGNPLFWAMQKISFYFDIEQHTTMLILILCAVALFNAVMLFVARFLIQLLSIRVTRDLREQYFEHIQSLPLSFYQEQNLGSLTSRVTGDAGQIASSLNSCLTTYCQTPFTIITTLFTCVYLSWRLSMIIFVGLPLIVLPVVFLTRKGHSQIAKKSGNFHLGSSRFSRRHSDDQNVCHGAFLLAQIQRAK